MEQHFKCQSKSGCQKTSLILQKMKIGPKSDVSPFAQNPLTLYLPRVPYGTIRPTAF